MKKLTRKVGLLLENNQGKILVLKNDLGWGLVDGTFENGDIVQTKLVSIVKDKIDYSLNSELLKFIDVFHLKRPTINQKYSLFFYKITEEKPSLNPGKGGNIQTMWADPSELYQQTDLAVGLAKFLERVYQLKK